MNDYELPSFDDDTLDPYEALPLPPQMREPELANLTNSATFDTSTSVHTIPDRMTAVAIKCRCGGKLGYRDPNTPRLWCGGCGRNL